MSVRLVPLYGSQKAQAKKMISTIINFYPLRVANIHETCEFAYRGHILSQQRCSALQLQGSLAWFSYLRRIWKAISWVDSE